MRYGISLNLTVCWTNGVRQGDNRSTRFQPLHYVSFSRLTFDLTPIFISDDFLHSSTLSPYEIFCFLLSLVEGSLL